VLGHYVRELGVLSLTEAVRKMTGAVAQRLGMNQRGTVAEGNWADLVVFDPDEIGDLATWTEPKETAVGMHYVFVNGEMAIDKGQPTGGMVGGFLKRGDR
jgi:N-acyl-D-amino-acid deacylase